MKKITLALVFLLFACVCVAGAQPITFSEVSVGTTDPTIDGISFWAGNPDTLSDTIIGDSWSSGNPYLMSGFDDGTGKSPHSYNTFIGVNPTSGLFGTVSLDILSENQMPGGTTLLLQGMLGVTAVESTSITVALYDYAYHPMTLAFANGADTLYIYDDLNSFSIGESFHIDNFTYSLYQEGPKPVPEPSTMVLVSIGLIGAWLWKKRKNNS